MFDLRLVLTILPLLWTFLFTFQEFSALALLGLLIWMMGNSDRIQGIQGSRLLQVGIRALFLVILYAPVMRYAQFTWLVPAGAILLSLIVWGFAVDLPGREKSESWWVLGILLAAVFIPLIVGGVPTLLLKASPLEPSSEMIPLGGWLTACWTLLFWGALSMLFLSGSPRTSGASKVGILIVLVAIGGSLVFRSFEVKTDLDRLAKNPSAGVAEWEDLLYRSKTTGVPGQADRAIAAALESDSFQASLPVWVSWAKDLSRDKEDLLEDVSLRKRVLAIGGKPWEEEIDPEEETFVALEIDPKTFAVTTLTGQGNLFQVGESNQSRSFEAEVGPFVHMCLGPRGETILLEAGGRVLSVSGDEAIEIIPTRFSPDVAFMIRIARDPARGTYWSLDRYGILYRADLENRIWFPDERFLPHAKTPDGSFPTAQDIAVGVEGALYFLNCYGEVWSSSGESGAIIGPIRGAHFFPDFPVAQSLGIHDDTLEIVDRYGGFYPEPYPTDPDILLLRNSHLFPRSLPRRDPEVVDHVFLPEHRWLHLLTKSGRILTNKKWHSYWAR